jgi:hypothetical protein
MQLVLELQLNDDTNNDSARHKRNTYKQAFYISAYFIILTRNGMQIFIDDS